MAPPRESARSRTFFAVAISASISSVERLRASSIFGRAMLAAHARAVVARAVPTKIRRPLAVARSAKRKRKSFMCCVGQSVAQHEVSDLQPRQNLATSGLGTSEIRKQKRRIIGGGWPCFVISVQSAGRRVGRRNVARKK